MKKAKVCICIAKFAEHYYSRRRTMYDDELHEKASAYASNRKDAYLEKMRKKEVEQQTNTQLNWLWVAHYEGYKEGYWAATGNDRYTTDPAKLKEKNT
jgi:hypothetical protein